MEKDLGILRALASSFVSSFARQERPCVFIKPILELSQSCFLMPSSDVELSRTESTWIVCWHSVLDNQDRALSLPYGMVVAMNNEFGLGIDVT